MKIVVLDGYTENPGDLSWKGFEELGQLTVYNRTAKDDIIGRIKDAEIVITNKAPIDRETLEACPKIRYIGVLATGYNVVDVEAAAEKRDSRNQYPHLWNGGGRAVCDRASSGNLPSYRIPQRSGSQRTLGK